MINTNEKTLDKRQKKIEAKTSFFRFILNPKRIVFIILSIVIFTAFTIVDLQKNAFAAVGINPTINFQGKVVNKDGTNVADGQYTFVFKLYDASSGGSNLWTETQNNVQVTAGIFRVSLGSVTSLSGVNFNSDTIYLGINFNSDGEMTPRVRFASVPYAFNAQQVNGLTVTNTSDNAFSSATTLKIADGKTVVVNAGLTFSGTDSTTFTFPSTGGNVVTEGFTQTLTNKTIGSTGLTFSGANLDITTGTNEDLTITPNGTGSVLINPSAGGSAALVINKTGNGDIFAASSSGVTKFVLKSDGTASSSAGFTIDGTGNIQSTKNQTLTLGGNATGDIQFKPGNASTPTLYLASNGAIGINGSYGGLGQCLLSNGSGSAPSWGGCAAGTLGGWFNFVSSQGTLLPVNQTVDLLWGGNSTASAGFRISGATKNYGTVAAASVSANTSFAGFVIDNKGSGELLTASSSGLTRFTIYNSGNVVIGDGPDSGFKLDVKGSVRIGNNTNGDDINKQTTADFTQSGYSVTSSDGVDDITTSNNQLSLVTDLIGAGGTTAAPVAGPSVGQTVGTNSLTFQRPDRDFVLVNGNHVRLYDPVSNTFGGGVTFTTGTAGSGLAAFQRADGNFVVVVGGGTGTQIYNPSGSTNEQGTFVVGPATTAAVGAGSVVIRRTDGKVLLVHGGGVGTTSVYDPTVATALATTGTFIVGPAIAASGTVTTGSFQFGLPNGKWLVGLGGGTTTNIYDPNASAGGGSGGTFVAGPSLSAASGAGAHVIQLPDGRMMVILGGTTGATSIYNPISNTFSAGPTLASAQTVRAGGHSFQRSDGKWVVVLGGGSTNLQLYDPTNGADGVFSTLASGLTGAGAGSGAHTFQRPDGMYVIVNANSQSTTTLYDAGWNTSGTWTSEDINSTKISTYSAMLWDVNPQSANNNARLENETLTFSIKTADTQANLAGAQWRVLNDNGLLIKAAEGAAWAKIKVDFSTPVRSYQQAVAGVIFQRNIWAGEGEVFYRRSFLQPSVFSIKVQNPLVSYGDTSGTGDPGYGRNFATASAQLEGVFTDNSNRLMLATNRNLPTASASGGLIFASASANLGATAGAGTHTIERNNGQFLVIIGGTATTRVYDSGTNTFSAGPALPVAGGAGGHSFLLPDGRFFTVLGGTTNKTAIYDPQSNTFSAGPDLYGTVGLGANTFQRPDGLFIIVNGGATITTNILDPFSMGITQGPFTLIPIGAGALNIKRPDGRTLLLVGNTTAATQTEIYDAATNTFTLGPAFTTGSTSSGSTAVQLASGRWWIKTATTISQLYDPYYGTFAVGPTANGTLTAGAVTITRPDGKFVYMYSNDYNVIDGAAIVAGVAGTNLLPCTLAAGSNVFQRPSGEFVVLCGASANTFIVDAGWNLGGTYTSEPLYEPNLSSSTGMYWKNISKERGEIHVKYRTASTSQALGVASWKQLPDNGSLLSITPGDVWFQTRIDLVGVLEDLPGAKTRVWLSESNGGAAKYYQNIQTPILQYWKLENAADPNLLTLSSNGSNIFRFNADGQAFTDEGGAWNSGGADLAERYQSQDALEAGEVVSLDRLHPQNTHRSTLVYDQNAMGVVSTQPGFVAGAYTENSYPVALVGRVPVKVSTENGAIHAGDYLTSASIPGYAMKATVAGRVIGQAMEDFMPDQIQDCPKFGAGSLTATQCGSITVFVNLTSYNGESVEVQMKDKGFALREEELPIIAGLDFTEGTDARRQQEVLGFLNKQKDNGQQIYTDRVVATQEVISPQIVTDLLVAKKIKAESIEGLEIITNSIESLSNQFATGSASSLRAGSAVTSFSDRLNLLALNQKDFETQISSLSAKLDKMSSLNILGFIAQGSTSGELTMVNNLASYGTATLSEASVINTITIGTGSTLNLSNNSLYTLGDDLSIQPFRQGAVNFLGGLIKFDTDGKATFGEDVTFAKNVGVAGVLSAKTVSSTELQLGQGTTTVVSDTEVTATAAAGLVTLKKNTDHIKVNNPLVKDNSFIFITPKTKTDQQLFLFDQQEGESFTVGVDGKATDDIKFNYLIVN